MTYLISPSELKKLTDNIAIVDVRFDLTDSSFGKKAYLAEHIPGAVFLDLNVDLSGEVVEHGGAHPLPSLEAFASKLGAVGIDEKTTVIVYDQENEMYAPRLWWMLQSIGHKKVFILDGGFKRWIEEGNAVTTELTNIVPKKYAPQNNWSDIVDIEDVKEKVRNGRSILIDSRARERYLGKTEPLYQKAGHIPGAKNYFWEEVLHEDRQRKNDTELRNHFAKLPKEKEIIVSCGSGVSACANIFALKMIGYENIKLYPGGYSDWISYHRNKVETVEE